MTGGVLIRTGGLHLALRHRTAVCAMHHRAFSTPPLRTSASTATEQEAAFDHLLENEAFSISVALRGGRLQGFAYGHRLPPEHRWWEQFTHPVPGDVSEEWTGRTCALIDLVVHESCRRQGLARQLVRAFLGTRAEERALLSVRPANEAAHCFYRADGWTFVGRKGPITEVVPAYWDIYRKQIRTRP